MKKESLVFVRNKALINAWYSIESSVDDIVKEETNKNSFVQFRLYIPPKVHRLSHEEHSPYRESRSVDY